jgi:hypothetical protein
MDTVSMDTALSAVLHIHIAKVLQFLGKKTCNTAIQVSCNTAFGRVSESIHVSMRRPAAKTLVIPRRQTGARWRARETHGVMPNPRQVALEGKRSPSSKSALHKGFSTYFYCGLGNGKSPGRERGYTLGYNSRDFHCSKIQWNFGSAGVPVLHAEDLFPLSIRNSLWLPVSELA